MSIVYVSAADFKHLEIFDLNRSHSTIRDSYTMTTRDNTIHRYIIHDNGGRPYSVEDDGSKAIVSYRHYDFDRGDYLPPEELFQQPYEKLFVGDKPAWQVPENWDEGFEGNTILLKLEGGTYMYIGETIYTFKTLDGDVIHTYFSEVGNNDVPYPFAIGEKYVYFLMDYHEAVPKDYFDLKKDVYEQYYLDDRIHDCKHQPTARQTDLCKAWKRGDRDLREQLDYLTKERKVFPIKMIRDRV
jgi:hypothetical protein